MNMIYLSYAKLKLPLSTQKQAMQKNADTKIQLVCIKGNVKCVGYSGGKRKNDSRIFLQLPLKYRSEVCRNNIGLEVVLPAGEAVGT